MDTKERHLDIPLGSYENPVWSALNSTRPVERSFEKWLEGRGVSFTDDGETGVFINVISASVLKIGSPYYRYFIVIKNTDKELDKIDPIIIKELKGKPVGPRKSIFNHANSH